MRVFGLILAEMLALSVTMSAYADQPGGMPGAGSSVARSTGSSAGWRAAPGGTVQWRRGWVSPPWANRYNGGWIPHGGPVVPTYWVWGPNGGAFDYPFADWRGPTGGWGNP
jgi:hypothetical protein